MDSGAPAGRLPRSGPVAGVVLAAGGSTRMGTPKALLDAEGTTFVARLAGTLRRGGCDPVVVVAADGAGPVGAEAKRCGARLVVNPGGRGGQIGSLRAALADLRALDDPSAAVLFTPVDNPAVSAATVRTLIEAWERSEAAIVAPNYQGKRGHPVLADMSIAAEFLDDGLAEGARTVVRRDPARVLEVPVPDPATLDDIDTARAYRDRFPEANLSAAQVAARVLEALEQGERIYTAVVTDAPDASLIGRRWWFCGTRSRGTLGSRLLDEAVAAAVPSLFPPRESRGALSRDFEYREGDRVRTARVYLELHGPPPRMVIVGAGHIAIPLARMGAILGMRIEVLDDRPDFAAPERFPDARAVRVIDFRDPFADTPLGPSDHVILVTRGHSFDYECLVRLLRMSDPPAYIGMIGSRRRVRATHEQLAREGFTTEEMKRVRAPVGLDLGGQTPAEIAVAVVAEVILFHAGGTGVPLVEKERVVERFFGGAHARKEAAESAPVATEPQTEPAGPAAPTQPKPED